MTNNLISPRCLSRSEVEDVRNALFEGVSLTDLRSEYLLRGSDLGNIGAKPLDRTKRYTTSAHLGGDLLDSLGVELVLDEDRSPGIWTWCSLYAAEDLCPAGTEITPRKDANQNKFVPETNTGTTRKGRVYVRSMARIVLEARATSRSRDRLLCMPPAQFNNRVIQHIVGGTGRFSMLRHPVILDLLEHLYVRKLSGGYVYQGHLSGDTHIDGLVRFFQEVDQTYCLDVMNMDAVISLLPSVYQQLLPEGLSSPCTGSTVRPAPVISPGFYNQLKGLIVGH